MKRSYLIIIIILLIIAGGIGGAYLYLMETTKTIIHSELSERSKEFLANQVGSESGELRGVSLDKKRAGEHDFDSNRIIVKNCYSMVVPFAVSDDRQNDPCVYYAILESPRGNMTTSLREVGFSTVVEAPDVTFRRNKKSQYKETSFTNKGISYLVFMDTETNGATTAFAMVETGESNKILTITLGIGDDEDLKMRQLKKIADSFELE